MPLAYRVEDAAAAIGLSRSTLFEYIKHGRIPSRKIGNSTIIRHCDLERHPIMLDHMRRSLRRRDSGGIRLA
nr:helix-turn-helix domain-containing protein [Methylobacterium sp. yr668]